MGSSSSLAFSVVLSIIFGQVAAHVQIFYPPWRNNSFIAPFSQQIYPCAGISDTSGTNRTLWPLTGGSLNITLHDSAAIIFVNLGLGANATNFNISLLAAPLNETGAGNVCWPQLVPPPGLPISEGTQATIQVATSNPKNGAGLYNCADITFSSNATLLPADQCQNSSTVSIKPLWVSNTTNSSISSGATQTAALGMSLLGFLGLGIIAATL